MSKRVLVVPDLHCRPEYNGIPTGEDTESLKAVLRYAADQSWHEVVLLGDVVDLDCLSSHNHGKPKLVENQRLQADYDHANRFLDKLQKAVSRNACSSPKITYIEGNHEFRATRYAEAFPAMAGKVEVPVNLRLNERGINWVPFWSEGKLYRIGNAYFGHGRSTTKYHAQKNLTDYGVPYYYGHCFDKDTEVLTPWGWAKVDALSQYDSVATYNLSIGKIEYQVPTSRHQFGSWPSMLSISGQNTDLLVTDQHGLVDFMNREPELFSACDFKKKSSRKFLCAAIEDRPGLPQLSDDMIRLIVQIAADGSLENRTLVRFHLKKNRKIVRLKSLLSALSIRYSENSKKTTKINFTAPNWLQSWFDWSSKGLPAGFKALSPAQVAVVLEEYLVTDGSRTGPNSIQICTSKRFEADMLQSMFVTSGFRCNLLERDSGAFVLSVNQRTTVELRPENATESQYSGKVWCVTVPNGTLLVRRNGKVTVTQNTHDVQEFSMTRHGDDKTICAKSYGCLCRYNQPYMQGKPSKWQQAFGVFHVDTRTGFFNDYCVKVFGSRFVSPEGHKY